MLRTLAIDLILSPADDNVAAFAAPGGRMQMSDEAISSRIAAPALPSQSMLRRAVLSCAIGQVFENYDFVLYGFMAAALAHAFFPAGDSVAALLSTFATFA